MREVLVGFDSAWTDSSVNPGAIAALVLVDGEPTDFHAPILATFDAATVFIQAVARDADYTLIAIDQPTVVPNEEGCRPVDRVAGSLISRLCGGVQPARRGGLATPLFGDGAPIWRFLRQIDAIQDPLRARDASERRFVMEVFPALALPAFVPALWQRGRGAKYNPSAAKFDGSDWPLVASGVASFAQGLKANALSRWAATQARIVKPRKADQDRLDAAICLSVALAWRRGSRENLLVVGDERRGYIATVVSTDTRNVLVRSASERHVPVNREFSLPDPVERAVHQTFAETPDEEPASVSISKMTGVEAVTDDIAGRPAPVDPAWLRRFLVDRSQNGHLIAYGDVASALGFPWSQGFGTSLIRALNILGTENRAAGEPLLMCLVVNKATRLPGQGFYDRLGHGDANAETQRRLLIEQVEQCRRWHWT